MQVYSTTGVYDPGILAVCPMKYLESDVMWYKVVDAQPQLSVYKQLMMWGQPLDWSATQHQAPGYPSVGVNVTVTFSHVRMSIAKWHTISLIPRLSPENLGMRLAHHGTSYAHLVSVFLTLER